MKRIPVLFEGYAAGIVGWSFHIVQNEMIKSLNRLGADVYIENCHETAEPILQELHKKTLRFDGIGVRVSPEDEVDRVQSRVKTAFFYSAETSVKNEHADKINNLDAVFVAARSGKALLERSGVNIPVYVWSHGYDPVIYKPSPRTADGGTVRYLFVGQNWQRKGLDILLDVWSEFASGKDVRLMLKMNQHQYPDLDWLKDRGLPQNVDARYDMYYDPQDVVKYYYNTHDVFVLSTRSEGFGMTVLEAAACGMKIIVTESQHCGYNDFIKDIPHYGVRSERLVPRDDGYCEGLWENPMRSSLLECLNRSYESHKKCDVGETRYVPDSIKNWTWDERTKEITPILEELVL